MFLSVTVSLVCLYTTVAMTSSMPTSTAINTAKNAITVYVPELVPATSGNKTLIPMSPRVKQTNVAA